MTRPALPVVKNVSWVHNPIDAFVLHKLEAKGLSPSSPVDRRALVRRVTYDLTGLPPTPNEVETFLKDKSANAYAKLVDRLLSSPRYGERWAMYWLDLARYAETDGFNADGIRPNIWRYRDYVIRSFNQDKPYDQFIREQIAGDELYPESNDALIATGFNRHFPDEHNARNIDQRRQEVLNDITDVAGQVFLGLTFGCARCHDHRYDPISQKDYYQFQAFFAAFSLRDELNLADAKTKAAYDRKRKTWEEKTKSIRAEMAKLEAPYRKKVVKRNKDRFLKKFQDYYDMPPEKRTPYQKQLSARIHKQLIVRESDFIKNMKKDVRKKWDELKKKLRTFDKYKPRRLPVARGITDVGPQAPPVHFLHRGNFKNPGDVVPPDFPHKLSPVRAAIPPVPSNANTTGRRTVLARWIASPDNPLTARVMVNRLWQHHFGRGIAATTSDLGNEGEAPTHPQLLDWLATEFVRRGWSLKKMHRLMVLSNTYRQSSRRTLPGDQVDSENRLLWRMNMRRLEGESLRDAMLAVSGRINYKMGGRSVFPPLPKGVRAGGWSTTKDKREQNRRSIYVFLKRNLRYPLFGVFDAPDSNETCARRHVSTNAPQALTLLNGEFTLASAQAFASRVLYDGDQDVQTIANRTYQLALNRLPDQREIELAREFFSQQTAFVRERLKKKQSIATPSDLPAGTDRVFAAVAVEYCHVVLNLNEFLYVD